MSLLNDFCENRNALIVGGSSGIGLATAKLLANEGVNVVLVGKNGSKLEEAVKAVSTFTNVSTISINAIQVDLYKPADVQKLIKYVEDAAVPFHYLINAAGYFNPKPFLQHTCEDYDVYHDLNKSLFFITQAVAKRMSQHSVGSIVMLVLCGLSRPLRRLLRLLTPWQKQRCIHLLSIWPWNLPTMAYV
jgi:short-subunit dehydrogenase